MSGEENNLSIPGLEGLNLTPVSQDIFEKARKEREAIEKERLAYLKENSKPLEELIYDETFYVTKVDGENHSTGVWNGGIGPISNTSHTGYTSKLTLTVQHKDSDFPVKTLEFFGYSGVRGGDTITARIPRFSREEWGRGGIFGGKVSSERTFYLDREYHEVEEAIEMQILSEQEVIRTDKSVNYKEYVEKDSLAD